jgi:signal transduction histidine kinase
MFLLPQVVLLWDARMRCVAFNKRSELNHLAIDPEFAVGEHLRHLPVSERHRQKLSTAFHLAAQLQQEQSFVMHLTVNGRLHEINVTVSALFDDDQKLIGWLTQSVAHKQADTSFESTWQALFQRSSEHYMQLHPGGAIQAVNRAFQGKAVDLWVGHNFTEVLHPREQALFTSALARTVESVELTRFEIPIESRWYAITLSPWVEPNTEKAATVIMRLEDVTDLHLKRIEEEGHVALLNDALSGADEAMALLHASGRFIFRNTTMRETLSGNPLNLQDLHHLLKGRLFRTDGKTPMETADLAIFSDNLTDGGKQRFCIIGGNGSAKVLESSFRPLLKERDEVYYYLWTLRDITRDERQMRLLIEEKQEISQILRATSHDMRSAVSNIQNLSQLIQRNKEPEAIRALSDRLHDSSKALVEVFEGMLELARSRAEDAEHHESIDLKRLINEVRLMLPAALMNEHTVFEEALEVDAIDYNKAYLRSILYNLLVNALKYADGAKDEIHIKVQTQRATNGIWLIVADNGIGMDLEVVKNDLFKPFTRFTKQSSGSGVGLSLVKHFVEKNGGEVHVESKKGEGTTFKLLLRSYDPEQRQYELF